MLRKIVGAFLVVVVALSFPVATVSADTVLHATNPDRRQHFSGASTDTKPTAPSGSTFYETDTQRVWILSANGLWQRAPFDGTLTVADGPSADPFSRMRVAAPFGIFENKNITSRNRNQWEELYNGLILTYTGLTGTFQNGEEVRGATSPLPVATIVTDNGATSMTLVGDHNDFVVGGTITGQTSGATATIATTNTGSDISYQYDRASVYLQVGTASGDYAIRQTHRYNAYVPGKGQLVLMTFVLGAQKTNVTKRVGFFDAHDGLFLQQDATGLSLCRRSSTSGSSVDTCTTQDNWSIDSLDGGGDADNLSGITLDATKAQILVIDFQWLGVGRVRFGFDIDGKVYYVHEINNANSLDVVYMRTPSLPVRYEIRNTGATASATILEEICSSVASEGGYTLPGLEYAAGNAITPRAVTTRAPIFAFRLKAACPTGEENRRIAKLLQTNITASTNDALVEVVHLHDPLDITATWTDVGGGSCVEYSTDISAITGRPAHVLEMIYAATTAANKASSTTVSSDYINLHGYLAQNHDSTNSQAFAVFARSVTGTASVYISQSWIEFD